jgi:hypothetical protein
LARSSSRTVSTMIGTCVQPRSAVMTSRPLMPGRPRSSNTRSGCSLARRLYGGLAGRGLEHVVAAAPQVQQQARLIWVSSSTTSTRVMGRLLDVAECECPARSIGERQGDRGGETTAGVSSSARGAIDGVDETARNGQPEPVPCDARSCKRWNGWNTASR